MNREQMIDLGAEAYRRFTGTGYPNAHNMTRVILDAILPQVTTVEELEALPPRTALTDRDGRIWRHPGPWGLPWFRNDHDSYDHRASDVLKHGPLTVVWRP